MNLNLEISLQSLNEYLPICMTNIINLSFQFWSAKPYCVLALASSFTKSKIKEVF